jgi:UDP-N-acetylglucosamine diphosphorylase / glucose-1-phosphate thymidylyltransferase / UDP-N-acetylgalactosamine diphosphorylase / glucosamine-1-phosphate N-acetyltransferase / galactosamine-1-phosphate N-acetyltransferase
MNDLALYLFDDGQARAWQPFALTRPVGELLLGAFTFRQRAERVLGTACRGHIAAEHLAGFDERGAAPVRASADVATDAPRLFLSSRVVLEWGGTWQTPSAAATVRVGDAVVGCFLPAGSPNPTAEWFLAPSTQGGSDVELPGQVVEHVWDLIALNAGQIMRDFEGAAAPAAGVGDVSASLIAHLPGMLRLGSGVTIEPGVVIDFSDGPVWLSDDVTVRAFTRLAGPAWVGPGSTLLGGPYAGVSIGPVCKIHGEVEESVVLGYSNKAHDGFLGHAYLGRWVNLGAMTTNSDLKNNYGAIRMWTPDGDVNTGLIKLGSLIGDYVKTGIGALLNTGTVIGAGSNLYGTAMPPKYVPPFSWGSGSELAAFDADKFLQVTATVMGRRSLELSEGMRAMLRAAWALGRESV